MTADNTEEYLTPNAIRKMGIDALTRELGPVGMVRFLHQFDPGEGDYTKERDALLAGITMEDVLRELEEKRNKRNQP